MSSSKKKEKETADCGNGGGSVQMDKVEEATAVTWVEEDTSGNEAWEEAANGNKGSSSEHENDQPAATADQVDVGGTSADNGKEKPDATNELGHVPTDEGTKGTVPSDSEATSGNNSRLTEAGEAADSGTKSAYKGKGKAGATTEPGHTATHEGTAPSDPKYTSGSNSGVNETGEVAAGGTEGESAYKGKGKAGATTEPGHAATHEGTAPSDPKDTSGSNSGVNETGEVAAGGTKGESADKGKAKAGATTKIGHAPTEEGPNPSVESTDGVVRMDEFMESCEIEEMPSAHTRSVTSVPGAHALGGPPPFISRRRYQDLLSDVLEASTGTPTTHTTDNDGLTVAWPVTEDPIPTDLGHAQGVDVEAQTRKTQERERKAAQCMKKSGLLATILVLAGVGIFLGIFFGSKNNGSPEETSEPSSVLSAAPSESPSAAPLDYLLSVLPDYTTDSLKNRSSAQSLAFAWLERYQNVSDLAEWRKTQLFALATFYYAMGGPKWPNGLDKDWLDDTKNECHWYSAASETVGPLWDSLTGDFAGNQGSQSCNTAGKFQKLNLRFSIDVSGLSVSIPREIQLLSSLVEIELFGVGLSANLSGDIWPTMALVKNLEVLSLGFNSVTGTIPTDIGTMKGLRQLKLDDNVLSGPIPTELGLLTSLELLALGLNRLSGAIPSELTQLEKLQSLDVSFSSVTGQIPSEIALLTDLQECLLVSNKLTSSIPTELGALASLQLLKLGHNDLSGQIPSELGMSTMLQNLDLENNRMFGSLPSELAMLSSVGFLDVSSNSLSAMIPTEMGFMTLMRFLRLNSNTFSGQLPTELGLLTALKRLNVEQNMLSGSTPSELGGLGSLDLLRLNENSLSHHIPSELGLLNSTQEVYLNGNMLSGLIPNELASLMCLNNTGGVPNLDLLPPEQNWFGPDCLFRLDVSDNPLLTGTVPDDLCLMKTPACLTYEFNWFEMAWQRENCTFEFDCTDSLCGCNCECNPEA